jgi:hypothetical protein
MLDEDKDTGLLGGFDELLVVFEGLGGGLGDEHVDFALNGVEGNGVVSGVWGEDCDGIAGGEGVNGGLVSIWVTSVVRRERLKRRVEPIVGVGDVLLQMLPLKLSARGLYPVSPGCLTNRREFVSRDADHAQFANLATSAQVEHCQANNTDFLVGAGSLAINEAGGILSSPNLIESVSSSRRA